MNCRTAAELACRSLDAPLPASHRAGLGVHTLFCGPCRRFHRQLIRLDAACRVATTAPPPDGEGLAAAARERITAALQRPPPD